MRFRRDFSFDFLQLHILHHPDKIVNSEWFGVAWHVYRTYKVLVIPDRALQKDSWILLDLKMILLEC